MNRRANFSTIGYWFLVALLLALSLAGSLYWIDRNVVLIGHDAGGHLWRTLEYADLLQTLSLQTLFQALTYHHYRPPGFYLLTQPFYRLFGYSTDAAQLQNVLWLAAILLLTLYFGWRHYGRWVGLLAMTLTGFLPMLAAMTRLFYLENAVTALVLLALIGLAANFGFTTRKWALVWGASLGLGLLIKWSIPAYAFLPSLYAAWPVARAAWQDRRNRRVAVNGRALAISLMVGLALALPIALANSTSAARLPLGNGLFVLWGGLVVMVAYLAQRPSAPINNLLLGGATALVIAAPWYLARIDFVRYLGDAAYGDYGGNYDAFHPLSWRNYTRYFSYLTQQHLGWLMTGLLLPVVILWAQDIWRWRKLPFPTRILWLSIFSTYLFFSFASQDGERNLVPMLPPLMLLVAAATLRLPQRWAIGLSALWILCLGLQWAALTFDGLARFARMAGPLWASGAFLTAPASGATDPGYWIAPDVLARIDEFSSPDSPASFGMLVNSDQIHRGVFRYLIQSGRLDIELTSLTDRDTARFGEVFAHQWILLKNGDNKDVEPVGRDAVKRILAGDPLFHALYKEAVTYPLPNGDTTVLYRRREGPGHPYADPSMAAAGAAAANLINDWYSEKGAVLIADKSLAVWLGLGGLEVARVMIFSDTEKLESDLAAAGVETLFAVLSNNSHALEEWLDGRAVKALESGDDRLAVAVYGLPNQELVEQPIKQGRGDVVIERLRAPQQAAAGRVVQVQLALSGNTSGERKLSLRLRNEAGDVIAQLDKAAREDVTAGLFIPPATLPGRYKLIAIPYDSLKGLPLAEGETPPEIHLATLFIPE